MEWKSGCLVVHIEIMQQDVLQKLKVCNAKYQELVDQYSKESNLKLATGYAYLRQERFQIGRMTS